MAGILSPKTAIKNVEHSVRMGLIVGQKEHLEKMYGETVRVMSPVNHVDRVMKAQNSRNVTRMGAMSPTLGSKKMSRRELRKVESKSGIPKVLNKI